MIVKQGRFRFLSFLAKVHYRFIVNTQDMSITLSEEIISQRLQRIDFKRGPFVRWFFRTSRQ